MTYYQLSNVNYNIMAKNLKLKFKNVGKNEIFLSNSLAKYLYRTKEQINHFEDEWNSIKKITNPYEYIHTPISSQSPAISKIKPLSRAFFKLIEICNVLDLFKNYISTPIKSFHLAEGPGGFIEAMTYLRFNKSDIYYGMTLIDDRNSNIPGWKKSELFLKKNNNVIIEKGCDGTGNLYNPENYKHCLERYKNSMDFITGDGGFDFSIDYNNQEYMAIRLILTQVAYAIGMQKEGGTFVLKLFDIFSKATLDIIFLLASFYSSTYIIKPNTSRIANSEKYIVCTGFKYIDTAEISNKFLSIICVLNNMKFKDILLSRLLDIKINYRFITVVEEINAIIAQQQVASILSTLRIIQNKERKCERIQTVKTQNIQKCISWCVKNKIPYHKYGVSTNIFLSSISK
jgi:23S rRNA U2552 (ribose-2'-O)-methylase RlmE/FtsJ